MIIKKDYDEIQNYLLDASNFKGFCDAVYFPESTEEISLILKEANKNKTPVTVSGNGTGLTGGRVPQGGIVIATDKLNSILYFDKDNKLLAVQPGVLLHDIKTYLANEGYFYPPDPTEEYCYIGGTVATNASGAKTFKYGSTRKFVQSLTVVLPDGEILQIERGNIYANDFLLKFNSLSGKEYNIKLPDIKMPQVKNASGYFINKSMDLIDLFIGSEGTLGIFTEIKIKVLPLPEKKLSVVVFFNKEENSLNFIVEARELSHNKNLINALALEFFDKNSLRFLSNYFPNIPLSSKAAVWFEQEITIDNENLILNEWLNLIQKHNGDENNSWFAENEKRRKEIEEFRHAISWKVNEYIASKNLRKLGTDVAVPDKYFINFYNFCKEKVKKENIDFVIYGHFGNSHIHLNMLPKNENEFQKGKDIYYLICKEAVKLGGSVSAEHGIGKIKKEYFELMYGKNIINEMKKIKTALDPNLILNKGNLFN